MAVPKYLEVADDLADRIVNYGEYPPGSKLPSRSEVAYLYSVTESVAASAHRALRERGLTEYRFGVASGPYVVDPSRLAAFV